MSKGTQSGVYGDTCAGGSPPFNRGAYYKDGICTLCDRPVQRWADGVVQPHVWKPKEELFGKAAKLTDPRVYNSAANRAKRELERRARQNS